MGDLPQILPHAGSLSRRILILPPGPREIRCRMAPGEIDLDLLDFLKLRFPFRTQKDWTERIRRGWVRREENMVRFYDPAGREPSVPDEIALLRKSGDFILVYKPAPMPVHAGGRYTHHTLISLLQRDQLSTENSSWFPVHRLDSVTSGLVLLARSRDMAHSLQKLYSGGEVRKYYLALVAGVPEDDEMLVDQPVRRRHGFVFECAPSGKPARTAFFVIWRGENCSLVVCMPQTGRTHQIRLHLRHWGYPVADDEVYGSGDMATPAGSTASSQKKQPDYGLARDSRIPGLSGGHKPQNRAISLLHYRLSIPKLKFDNSLFDFMPPAPPLGQIMNSSSETLEKADRMKFCG